MLARFFASIALALTSVVPSTAIGGVVVGPVDLIDTRTAGGDFAVNLGLPNIGDSGSSQFEMGASAYTLNSIGIMMSNGNATAGEVQVSLLADSGDSPGAVIEDLTPNPFTLPGAVDVIEEHTFTSSGTTLLAANTKYWVRVKKTAIPTSGPVLDVTANLGNNGTETNLGNAHVNGGSAGQPLVALKMLIQGSPGIAPVPEIDVHDGATTADPSIPNGGAAADFGGVDVAVGMAVKTFTIENTGTGPLSIPAIAPTGGNDTDFSVGGIALPGVISAASSATFTVTFDPSAAGSRMTTLSIANDDPDENPYTFTLSGTGTIPASPEINVNDGPTAADPDIPSGGTAGTFGSVLATGSETSVKTFSIDNTGTAALMVTAVAPTGGDAADFAVSGITLPATIPIGNSTTFTVTFDPSSVGAKTTTLNISNDDPDENPYVVTLVGNGVPDGAFALIDTLTAGGDFGMNLGLAVSSASGNPADTGSSQFQMGPSSHLLTSIAVRMQNANATNGSVQVQLLEDSGSDAPGAVVETLSPDPFELPDAVDVFNNHTFTSDGGTVLMANTKYWVRVVNVGHANASPKLDLTLHAGNDGTETNLANVHFNGGSLGAPNTGFKMVILGELSPEIEVLGNGMSIVGDGTNGPTSGDFTDFEIQECGTSTTSQFVVKNDGVKALNLTGTPAVTLTGSSDFTVTLQPTTPLAPAAMVNMAIQFTPSSAGLKSAVVSIATNDPDENPFTFNIQGTGDDTVPPSITCPANMVVSNDAGQCGAVVTFAPVVADDCDPAPSVVSDPPSGTLFPVGTTTVTCTALDASGNSSQCMFDVTVNDTENPAISCPADIAVVADPGECSAVVTFTASAADNCPDVSFICSPASGATFNVGTTTVTCTATDAVGNTADCTFNVTVEDEEAPTIICPADISVMATSAAGAEVTYTAPVGADNCPGVSVTCLPPSGFTFPIGVTAVTCTATDAAGNTSSCSFNVTVTDPPALTLSILAASIGEADGDAATTATVSRNTDIANELEVTLTSGDTSEAAVPSPITIPAGQPSATFEIAAVDDSVLDGTQTATITASAEDHADGTDTVDVTDDEVLSVTINQAEAQDDPTNASPINYTTVFSLPVAGFETGDVTLSGMAGPTTGTVTEVAPNDGTTYNVAVSGMVSDGTVTASVPANVARPVGVPIDIDLSPAGGTALNLGSTVYNGDHAVGAAAVNETGQPASPATGHEIDAGISYDEVTKTLSFDIAYGSAFGFVDLSSDFTGVHLHGPGVVNFPAVNTSSGVIHNLSASHNPSGTMSGRITGTVVLTAGQELDLFDNEIYLNIHSATNAAGEIRAQLIPVGSGNAASTSTDATVVYDTTSPDITCPADITVNNDAGACGAVVAFSTTASDGIDPSPSVVCVPPSGTVFDVGTTTVTCTATDASGNSTQCAFVVTVNDTEPPVAVCTDITVQLDASGNAIVSPSDVDGGSTDNCGIAALIVAPDAFTCTNIGANIVTLTVTDLSGNMSTCTATVTVEDNVAPVAVCADITVQLDASGNASITGADVDGGSSDNCGIAGLSVVPRSFTGANLGANLVTLTVVDVNGNGSTCTATVTVEDNTSPVITCPADITIECGGPTMPADTGMATATDNTPGVAVTFVDVSTQGGTGTAAYYNYVITRTWTATDVAGLTASCVQQITVVDTTPPVIGPQPDLAFTVLASGQTAPVTYAPTATDTCDPNPSVSCDPMSGGTFGVGTHTVMCTATDVTGNTSQSSFNIVVIDNYTDWKSGHFSEADLADPGKEATVWGNAADPDGDCILNIYEFLHGTDPNVFDLQPPVTQSTAGDTFATVSFTRRLNLTGTTLDVQVSSARTSGFAFVGNAPTSAPIDAEFETVTYHDDVAVTQGAPRFVNLVISQGSSDYVSETLGTSCLVVKPHTAATQGTLSFLGLQFVEMKKANGTITAVGSNTLGDVNAQWPMDVLTNCYVRITSGPNEGIMADIAANTGTTLLLSDDLSAFNIVGETYEIRGHTTISGVFGPNSEAGLAAGENSTAADNVILIANGGMEQTIFYSSLDSLWRDNNFAEVGGKEISPEEGFIIRRKQATPMNLYMQGALLVGKKVAPIEQDFTLVGTIKSNAAITLDELGLFTGDTTTGVASGLNPSDADNVLILNPDGSTSLYFYLVFGTTQGWVNSSYTPSGAVTVAPGTSFYIRRRSPNAPFNWTIPSE